MSIRVRFVATLLGVALLLVIPSAYALVRLRTLRDIALELRGRHAAAWIALGRLQSSLADLDRQQRSYLAAPDPTSRSGMWQALDAALVETTRLREAGYGPHLGPTRRALSRLADVTAQMETWVRRGRVDRATEEFVDRVRPAAVRVEATLDSVAGAIDRGSTGATRRAQEVSSSAGAWVLAGVALALLMALLLTAHLTRLVVHPLRQLRDAMATGARGELRAPSDLPYERRDELGEVSRSFRALTEQLARLTRLRAELVAVVGQDLKTPLHIVSGYVERLRELGGRESGIREARRGTEAGRREALEAIGEQIGLLNRQVQQLLDLTQLEAGALRLRTEEIHLSDLMTGLRHRFTEIADRRMIGFSVRIERSAPKRFRGDMDRLRSEVLGCLLTNAFEFTEPGGTVRLRAWGESDEVVFEIQDSGVGIPPEELDRMFDRFYRGREGARAAGVGPSLALAREIVRAHGGEIRVVSQARRGTRFTVRLPIRASVSGRPTGSGAPPGDRDHRQRKAAPPALPGSIPKEGPPAPLPATDGPR